MIGDRLKNLIPAGEPVSIRKKKTASNLPEYTVRFMLGFAVTGARVFGLLSPFAVGLTAASGTLGASAATALGGIIGYLTLGSLVWAIKYIAALILICTAAAVFKESALIETDWFLPLAAGTVIACLSFVTIADSTRKLYSAALILSDSVLAGGGAYFYKRALAPWSGNLDFEQGSEIVHTISVLILLSTVLITLSNVVVLNVLSIGRTIAVLIVFLASFKGGIGMGCATGCAIGLAMDAAAGGTPVFAMAYGFSGMVSGFFSKQNRLVFATAFILVDALAAVLSAGSTGVPSILYEAFAASVVFMLIPNSFMAKLGVLIPGSHTGLGALKAREYTRQRVEQASLAFMDLYETVSSKVGQVCNDSDISTVFDRAADTICLKCSSAAQCWNANYQSTLDVMNNAAPKMLERGKLEETDFPAFFANDCQNLHAFIAAINGELRGLLYRRQYRSRLQENRSAAYNQYSEIAAILHGISSELGTGIAFEPELEARLNKYLSSQGVTAGTAVFRNRGGRLHAEVAGSGISTLRSDSDYLEKLSQVLGVRLCTVEPRVKSDKLVLLEAEPLAANVGISCLKKDGQEVSGDKGAYFKTEEGVLYVILSDGMGSGAEAASCSSDAVRILERFLRSGTPPQTAVRMLNDLLLLKNETDTGCATIDLVCINLFTGEMKMFKYGAAPSYLRQNGAVRRVRAKSLALGLATTENGAPDQITMQLKPGSIAIIVTDGVSTGIDDGWVEDIMLEYNGDKPRVLSRAIISEAGKRFGQSDDMTVIAIQMSERA